MSRSGIVDGTPAWKNVVMPTDDDLLEELCRSIELNKPEPRPRQKRSEIVRALRRTSFASPTPHPLTQSGPKLKALRESSGWTAEEIADRTGVALDVLTAFEEAVPDAAEDVTVDDLERLVSACCGSLSDIASPEACREAKRKEKRLKEARAYGSMFDPWG